MATQIHQAGILSDGNTRGQIKIFGFNISCCLQTGSIEISWIGPFFFFHGNKKQTIAYHSLGAAENISFRIYSWVNLFYIIFPGQFVLTAMNIYCGHNHFASIRMRAISIFFEHDINWSLILGVFLSPISGARKKLQSDHNGNGTRIFYQSL